MQQTKRMYFPTTSYLRPQYPSYAVSSTTKVLTIVALFSGLCALLVLSTLFNNGLLLVGPKHNISSDFIDWCTSNLVWLLACSSGAILWAGRRVRKYALYLEESLERSLDSLAQWLMYKSTNK